MSGVVAVFAHPDDESLLAGGTLAACAAAGIEVGIVSMTRGEDGPGAAGERDFGAAREAELRAAARILGASWVSCLDFPDGRLAWVDEREAVGELIRRVDGRQPDVVITFGAEGLYWHPDHLAVHELAIAAFGRWSVLLGATWKTSSLRALVAALAGRGLGTDLWGLDPEAFGVADASNAVVLDVRPFVETKLRALRCHRSQLAKGNLFESIPADLAADFLGCEYFLPLAAGRAGRPTPLDALPRCA